jgi:hypothetical protein
VGGNSRVQIREGGIYMNRIEIIGLFTAMKRLAEKNDLESIEKIIDEVLLEAKRKVTSEKTIIEE